MSDFIGTWNRKDVEFDTNNSTTWKMLGAFPKGDHPKCEGRFACETPSVFSQSQYSEKGTTIERRYFCGTHAARIIKRQLDCQPGSDLDLDEFSDGALVHLQARIKGELYTRRMKALGREGRRKLNQQLDEALRARDLNRAMDLNKILMGE